MKLFVKVLRGDGCTVEVTPNTGILEIKKKIELELKVPVSQQTLVYLGKTLLDDKNVAFYGKIKDGAKVHLVIKKAESLHIVLERFLKKYYDESQTERILVEFMNEFNASVDSLSLDDMERLATSYLNDEGS